ncbi:MAG: PilT/PilU family type 4a pilus ATPase [Deltaproteobacteria bacterium]|nr:MAG: PilT/PilU family type 4a pilus ATPase [Deltaproteobacteria bacterium]
MRSRALVQQVRRTRFAGAPEVQAFAERLGALPGREVERLLELLQERVTDPVQHRHRCRLLVQLVRQSGDRSLFAPLMRALPGADSNLRAALVEALPLVNDPRHHAELCELLRSHDAGLRSAAAKVLSTVGGKTALARLTEMMAEREFPGRRQAIEVTVRIAGHHAIPAFLAALPVATTRERQLIVRYLGDEHFMAGDREGALQVLSELLTDDEVTIAEAAVKAFSALATEEEWFDNVAGCLESPHQSIVRAAVRGLSRFDSPQAIQALRGRLRAGPKSVRLAVLDTLEQIGTDAILPALVDALGHRQLAVRARAGEVLAGLGEKGSLEVARTVMWLLRSPRADVRRTAVEIARKVQDPAQELWPRLFELLRDEDWWVRERVADALVEIAGERLLPYAVVLLGDPSAPVRMFAVEIIRRLAAPRALGALARTANEDSDWWVRERAMQAMAELGDPRAGPYLVHIAFKEPLLRIGAVQAIAALKAPGSAEHVARLLQFDDKELRRACLDCLEELGDPSVGDAVVPLIDDDDPRVAERARRLAALWQLQAAARLDPTETLGSRLDRLLVTMNAEEADDLVLCPGYPPMAKRMGEVRPLEGEPTLTESDVQAMIAPILRSSQLAAIEAQEDVDFSYEVRSHGVRFRANVFRQFRGLSAVFRVVRGEIPSLDKLGLPPVVATLGQLKNGLVLIGGPTGSGKSTTLAALIDTMNRRAGLHIVTLEDPIEVVHPRVRSLVNQRELGTHTTSYSAALRATLREDPDVILVGEMRDLETISFAVTAAETGHLVLGTVHTASADTTLDRLINVFPPTAQHQVRSMLATSLRAVVCQHLLPRADGQGRVLACEVMLNNDAVAHLIRTGKTFQLPSVITTSSESGMQLMDADLLRLLDAGLITGELAWMKARDKAPFEARLAGPPADLRD